jgi:hypothetical protein
MSSPGFNEFTMVQSAIEGYIEDYARNGISLRVRRDFHKYVAVRRVHGDLHLNQAFDPHFTRFADRDFWLAAENDQREPIATYCVRHLVVENFYSLILSQALWFGNGVRCVDPAFAPRFEIPVFGGNVAHGGGLWVREDYRGSSKLGNVLPRLGRAIALRNWPLDYDTGMIRNSTSEKQQSVDRKATFMGVRVYGFARVHRFVSGWFPPEGRSTIMHLCQSTRAEAVASLAKPLQGPGMAFMASQNLDCAHLSTPKGGLRVGRRWRRARAV